MRNISKYPIFFVVVLCVVGLVACKDELAQELTGSIIGTVADAATGEPVSMVSVLLEAGGMSVVTGSDGGYLFPELDIGNYIVSVSKQGYSSDSKMMSVRAGESARGDFLLSRAPGKVTVDRDTLDFGGGRGMNIRSFNIVNGSYEDLQWTIEYDCKWIRDVVERTGVLPYGGTQTIVVFINRENLSPGLNTTLIVVRSSSGSSELVVTATAEGGDIVILDALSLMVQKTDIGTGDWESMSSLCANSIIGGYTDWRLPDIDELSSLYTEREYIGGFEPSSYWSSSEVGYVDYKILNFRNGSIWRDSQYHNHYARCVRTL